VSTQSNDLSEKELAMILLSVIIEYFSYDEIQTYYDQLNPIIEGYLQSGIPSLQTLSIECVNGLSQVPKAVSILKKYNKLIPLTLNALDLNNEDLIHKVFETFNEFVEIKKVLGPHLPQIIEKALIISENQDFGINLREVTLLFLELIAEKYARVLIKNHGMNFIDKIFQVGFKIASEDPEMYENQELTPQSMGIAMIYAYACNVPNEKVYPVIEKHLQIYGLSKNEHERAASCYILGYIADSESCLDHVRDNIDSLTNFIVDRMGDDSYVVREAAGECVGRFSEHVTTDFLDHHKKVMPCLLRVIKDLATSKHDMTVQKTLFALNEFVQNLDYDIKIYLEDIIFVLMSYVNAPQFSRDVKYWALVALASTIATAQKKIQPYMQTLLEAFHGIITAQGSISEQQNVKGQALMCAGRLASSCGKEQFPEKAIEVFTNFGLECLKSDNKFELRETAVTYFADLSLLIKEDIAPIFDTVLNEILKTMLAEDAFKKDESDKPKADKGFSLDSDSEDVDGEFGMDIDISQLDEKSACINALGNLSMNAPKLCQGRMKDILAAQEHLQHYFHENIKFHIALAYLQIATGMMRLNGVMNADDKFDWNKGSPAGSPLPADVMQYLNQIVFPFFYSTFDQEENKEVIERVLENMRELTEDFGPGVLTDQMENIMKYIGLFLEKKTFCQDGAGMADLDDDDLEDADENPEDDSEEEEEGDDGIDHDEVIFGNVTDLMISMARALGNEFSPFFARLAPTVVGYTSDKHPKSDKNMALGCLSEVFAASPGLIPTYFADYLPLLEKMSNTGDDKVNRNIAYSIGVLAEHAQLLFQPHVNNGLQLLTKLHSSCKDPSTQDNIVAASCRIVEFQFMPLPADQRPADFATIMDSVFDKVPFTGDETENETILKFAFKLYQQDQAMCMKYMEKIATTCVKVIADEKCADVIEPKFKRQAGAFIKEVVMQHAQATL